MPRQMYGKFKKLAQRLLAQLHPSNLVNTIFYLIFQCFDSQIVKNSTLEKGICRWIPIQTLQFQTALPTCQWRRKP